MLIHDGVVSRLVRLQRQRHTLGKQIVDLYQRKNLHLELAQTSKRCGLAQAFSQPHPATSAHRQAEARTEWFFPPQKGDAPAAPSELPSLEKIPTLQPAQQPLQTVPRAAGGEGSRGAGGEKGAPRAQPPSRGHGRTPPWEHDPRAPTPRGRTAQPPTPPPRAHAASPPARRHARPPPWEQQPPPPPPPPPCVLLRCLRDPNTGKLRVTPQGAGFQRESSPDTSFQWGAVAQCSHCSGSLSAWNS